MTVNRPSVFRLGSPLLLVVLTFSATSACGGPGSGGAQEVTQAPEAQPSPVIPGSQAGEAGGTAVPSDQVGRPASGTAWVIFGADTVVAELARTADERQQGLMYREALGENAGMLFVFDRAEVRSFWMQNTYIPLDIAYLDANQAIINILAMEPLATSLYESEGPALFALEVNQGWFAAHGIEAGDRAEIVFGG